jgi:hypothetical protein
MGLSCRGPCHGRQPTRTGSSLSGGNRAGGGWGSSFIRVRVEMTGSPKCGTIGKSQSVLMMINPIIFTRTRVSGG